VIDFGKASESGRVNVNFTNLSQFVKFSKNTNLNEKPLIVVNSPMPNPKLFEADEAFNVPETSSRVGNQEATEKTQNEMQQMFSFCQKKTNHKVDPDEDELMFATAPEQSKQNELQSKSALKSRKQSHQFVISS
jgi:hypothetical protein